MKIAISGFGRIGRTVLKIAFERPGIDIVAVNDVAEPALLAHLLRNDSACGVYNRTVSVREDLLVVGDREIRLLSEPNPGNLPWGELGIDVVVESTGRFRGADGPNGGYKDHLEAGAKKVILSAPALDEIEKTVVLGVNDRDAEGDAAAYSSAGGTSVCLAPVLKVLDDAFEVEQGFFTAMHAYTADQVLLDGPHPDLRLSRAAATNIIPAGTGAAQTIAKVLPQLEGKLGGMSMRVPVAAGSAADLVVRLAGGADADEINSAFRDASENSLKGIIEYSEAPLVSSDVRGNSHSAIYDSATTTVLPGGLVKIVAWYDNEFGYSSRLVDLARKLG